MSGTRTEAEGQVIRFAPRAGTSLRPGDTVTMVVSKGPRPIRVGNYEGTDAETAVEELEGSGLEVKRVERYDDEVAADLVIRQAPARGVRFEGDVVRLVVSWGRNWWRCLGSSASARRRP